MISTLDNSAPGSAAGTAAGEVSTTTLAAAGGTYVAGCELCEAARFTHWYHEDEICWVADCEMCETPMVVWRSHGVDPPPDHLAHMLEMLEAAGVERFGEGVARIDRSMRTIPDHFHAHARDPGWSQRRWIDPPSLYTGVGGARQVRN